MNPEEYQTTYKLQKMFANSQLPDAPVREVKIYAEYNGKFLQKANFFLYQGKWRNCEYNSRFCAIVINESEICSNIYVG